jgi:hypothetical protein
MSKGGKVSFNQFKRNLKVTENFGLNLMLLSISKKVTSNQTSFAHDSNTIII